MTISSKLKIPAITMLAAALSGPLPAQERLSLSQAVTRALEGNPELAIDAPGQQAARADLKAAKAGYLPRLDLEQSYLAGNNPVFVFGTLLTQRRFTAANFALPSLNSPDAIDNLQTRVTLQQNIWDFGRTKTRMNQANLAVSIADTGHADHVRQVLFSVYEAYYSVSLARHAVETANLALRSAQALEAQARARVETGLTVESDLLRSQVYVAGAQQQAIQAEGQLAMARAQLNRLMGTPLDASIPETAALSVLNAALPAEENFIAEQKRQRPDYQRLLAELNEAESAAQLRQKEFLPVLAGFASWEMDNPSIKDYGGNNWTAGFSLRWNIFAGKSDSAQLEAARLRAQQKRRQIAAMESSMALEIRRASIQYRAAEQQVKAAQAAEAQSEEGLRILKNRYDAGLATLTDLLSAETARSSARTTLAEANFRHRLSYANVEYAAGILSPSSAAMNLQ